MGDAETVALNGLKLISVHLMLDFDRDLMTSTHKGDRMRWS